MTSDSSSMQNFLREFVFIVFYRKRLIILTALVVFSVALALAILLPPVYQSSAKFFVNITEQLDPLQQERFFSIKEQMVRMVQNQKELIYSNTVMRKAVNSLYPDLNVTDEEQRIREIKQGVQVSPPQGESFEGTNVFYLTYQGRNPSTVHKVAGTITTEYLEAFGELSKSKADYSYSFYKEQVENLDRELKKAGTRLRNYEVRHSTDLLGILNLESGKTNVEVGPRMLLTQAMSKRQDLRQRLDALQSTINSLEEGAKENSIPVVMPEMEGTGRTLSAYRIKVAQLQLQINEMSTRYTNQYQPLIELKQELAMTIRLLRNEFDSLIKARKITAQSLRSELEEVEDTISQLEKKITMTSQERSTYESLKQDYRLAEQAYTRAAEQLEQARLATSLNQDKQNLTLVEEPQKPDAPVKPNRILLAIMGLFGGLLAGIALAMATDYFDHTIKTPEDIEHYLGVPCLGSISHVS